MRTTKKTKNLNECITVDTDGLQKILSCGRPTAVEFGRKAGARIQISSRRVLWNVSKIQAYLDKVSK